MKSSILGDKITYYQKNNLKNNSQELADLVSKKGFKRFDSEGITSFLTFRWPIGDLTMFEDLKKIPCGAEIKNGKTRTYWYPEFKEKKIPFEKAKKITEELLIKAIKKLIKEKNFGIPVSGGVDSSLVVALCRKIYPNKKIYTYSAGFYGDDEFEYSRIVAKKFKTCHKEKILSKEDYIGDNSLLRPLIRKKGEPLHPNEIALVKVEKMAKEQGCDTALCGEGSDDIFGGYGQNLRMYVNYKINEKDDKNFFKFFLDNYRYFSLEDRKKIVKEKYLIDDFKLLDSFLDAKEMPQDIRNKIFYFTQKIHTPGLIIRGANAMRFNNLETGFPYIDRELVDFVNSLPFEYKVHWKSKKHEKEAKSMNFRDISEKMDVPKYILKKIAEKYLPYKIIYRKKYGFPVPFEKWLKNLKKWPLNQEIFKTTDISTFSGWKKFMIINLNSFIEEFNQYK